MNQPKIQSDRLYLTEYFSSVQGETTLTGLPTFFIRLSGCNLRCTWCDTPYSFKKGKSYEIFSLIDEAKKSGCLNVCVTGGEPLLQPGVHPLMETLCDLGFVVSLETGGSLPIETTDKRVRIILDVKCPGSGMETKNLFANFAHLKESDEVKFVIRDREDYLFAKDVLKSYALEKVGCPILFSPVHDVLDPKELISWVLSDHLRCRINLQIHKYIWGAHVQGV